ncbi:MAG: FHA domain-containing protein [Oscillatoriales cyanobacterium]|nr:MAG: FHA domain-containing protein [Oscillatoriales cyanobacterium]
MNPHAVDPRTPDRAPIDADEHRGQAYDLFLKLYDSHRDLLEELIEAERHQSIEHLRSSRYIQGIVRGQQAYLISNLIDGKSQSLLQYQMIWMMGRDPHAALPIADQRLSRRHAIIQYISHRGFYLVDLGSTNGSFINGHLVRGRNRLRDGDRVRLGGFSFDFFVCYSSQTVSAAPTDLVAQLQALPLPEETDSSLRYKDALSVPLAEKLAEEETMLASADLDLDSDIADPLDESDGFRF